MEHHLIQGQVCMTFRQVLNIVTLVAPCFGSLYIIIGRFGLRAIGADHRAGVLDEHLVPATRVSVFSRPVGTSRNHCHELLVQCLFTPVHCTLSSMFDLHMANRLTVFWQICCATSCAMQSPSLHTQLTPSESTRVVKAFNP